MMIKEQVEALRRTYPRISISNARQLYAELPELKKRGKRIVLWTVLWAADGRVSLHRTQFEKKRPMSAPEWAGWLQVNLPEVMKNTTLAYLNRTFGSSWNIDRVFGWHFATGRRAK